MVSFRRYFIAFAVLALLTGVASAQIGTPGTSQAGGSLNCVASSAPTFVRSQGATELIGDIIISCTGGPTTATVIGAQVPSGTLTVTLSVPVTSRLLSNGQSSTNASTSGASEALLIIDEAGGATNGFVGPGAGLVQTVIPATGVLTGAVNPYVVGIGSTGAIEACNNVSITPGGASAFTAATGACSAVPNVYQGIVNNTFTVTFNNVPFLAPGTTGLSREFRITNIRADAAALGTPAVGGAFVAINANVSISPGQPFTLTQPPPPASVFSGLTTSVRPETNSTSGGAQPASLTTFKQCAATPASGSTPVGGAILRFSAGFQGAFKTRVAQLIPGATVGSTVAQSGLNSAAVQNIPGFP